MNFATLKGLTIPVPQTIVSETTETSTILLEDNAGLSGSGSYVVTVDGVEYQCDTFFNEMMEPSLGDSRLYSGDASNPVDVPFYIVSWLADGWSLGDPSIDEAWVCDVFYPDSNAHTIEIKKMVDASVTQITDASGRVLWAVQSGTMAVLQVAKQTLNTYAGETEYTGEQFILLDIYPKTNGTVSVTYGGLTKTITDTSGVAEPNAQQVFFGTFNGVSDSVTTPASGELTIEGDCYAFGVGQFVSSSKSTLKGSCKCITAIDNFGSVDRLPISCVSGCPITSVQIPKTVKTIAGMAFSGCSSLATVDIANGVETIWAMAFSNCSSLKSIRIPASVNSILMRSFMGCTSLASVMFDNPSGWYVTETQGATSGTVVELTNPTENARMLTETYVDYQWYRS